MNDAIYFNEFIISIYPNVYLLFNFTLNKRGNIDLPFVATDTYLTVRDVQMQLFYDICSNEEAIESFFIDRPKIFLISVAGDNISKHEMVVVKTSLKIDNFTYNLISIVCHVSGIHFIAYVKKNDNWWNYNDSQVEKKDLSTLGNELTKILSIDVEHIYKTCSLLYYERQDP
jgi:hypothetical protein